MSRLFLSHSSANNAEAVAIRDWLAAEGWNEVFLDLDPDRGIAGGERWERALNEAASRCEAVLFLISRKWLDSDWCLKEFNLARRLNKRLFGVLIEVIPIADLPADLTGAWQLVDLASGQDHAMFRVILPRTHEEAHVTLSKEGLARLRNGLAKAGLDPRFFAWPPQRDPDRPPYRGLKPLEAEDAGIFFGRDAPIVEALDTLRGLRDGAAPRLLVLLGASGAGKSSFLRAGLLPRLARDDRNFLVLPVIRPERAAISGETGFLHALETALADHGLAKSRASLREAVGGGAEKLRPLLQQLVDKVFSTMLAGDADAKQPVVVLAIDQAEELFPGEGANEGQMLLTLVHDLVKEDRPGVIALFTIRSDSYDQLETAKALEGIRQRTLPLLPMPRGAYQTVIEGPAARLKETRRNLSIEPRLTQRLLEDIEKGGGSDALPLLAFTLEQLYLDYGGAGALKLADYETFGGIRGAIEAAVERALAAAEGDARIPRNREARLTLLRRGLIPWLAGIDPETGSPRRRVARLADIPDEAIALINLLVEQRLLTTDRVTVRDGDTERTEITVEPAHEALLRQWGLLRGWLQDDLAALTTLEGVKRAARDWAANGRRDDWLNHAGSRLEEAQKVAARDDLAGDLSIDARDYLRQCRSKEEAERRREEMRLKADADAARERAEAALRLARRTKIATIVVSILLVIAVGVGIYALQQSRLASERAQDAEKAERAAKEQLAKAQIAQSRFLAAQADLQSEAGNHGTAVALALNALPADLDRPDRPFVMVAHSALFQAIVRLRERIILIGHADSVNSARFNTDGTRVATASGDKTARIWDASTGRQIAVLELDAALNYAAFSPDGGRLLVASSDKTARIYDAQTLQETLVLRGHDGSVVTGVFSPDGRHVLTASRDRTARIWDAITGQTIAVLRGHEHELESAAFSRDGKRVVTASLDLTARVWDAATGEQIKVLRGHERRLASAEFNPDGSRVLTASFDNTARIWDVDSGKQLQLLRHGEALLGASYSEDGSRVVTAPGDKTARVWDVGANKEIAVLRGHQDFLNKAGAFSPDGTRIVTASEDGTARIWDATDSKGATVLRGHEGQVWTAVFDRSGTRIVTASVDQTARIWDAATGRQIASLRGHDGAVWSAAFSPDAASVLTASNDQTARVWDVVTGRQSMILRGHQDRLGSAAYSADGTRIVTASFDRTARIWAAGTGRELTVLRGHERAVSGAAFSPDGTRVVTASDDRTARVWDAASGRQMLVLQEHAGTVVAAAFSPDGARVVTASYDRTARIWDAATGTRLIVLRGHETPVVSAVFSPDGTRVATTSYDKTARIWDAATGEEIVVLRGHGDRVWGAAFRPDGSRLATASWDGTARVWQVPGPANAEFLARAQRAAPRCLTSDERALFFLGAESPFWCTATPKWPYDPATLAGEARTFSRLKKYNEAIARFTEALRLDPSFVAAYVGRGDAYYDINEFDLAVADYTKAIALAPKYAIAYVERANAYRAKKEFELAIGDYNEAIRLNPKLARAYVGRGNAHYNKREYDPAITDYSAAIQIDPRYRSAYLNRGDSYRRKGEPDRAIADYDKAIELDGNYVSAYRARGRAYYDKKDYDRAVADFDRCLSIVATQNESYKGNPQRRRDLESNGDTIGGLAWDLLLARGHSKALVAADLAISFLPDQLWLYTNRAHALMFLGRLEEARELYLRYRGQQKVQDGKSWETVILNDFADLRKTGLTHPLMDEIEKRFAAGG